MKSRPSLKNSARAALNSPIHPVRNTFLFSCCAIVSNGIHRKRGFLTWLVTLSFLSCGCSVYPKPNHSLNHPDESLVKIVRDEYNIPIISRLLGRTLWIYLPLQEELFVDSDKPLEYAKKFEFKSIEGTLQNQVFSFNYDVREIPETKETQNKKFNPRALETMNKVLRSVRRVLFSVRRDTYAPRFFVTVTADTKSGIEIMHTTYIDDLKKAFYEIISWSEYQHRNLEEIGLSPGAIGDLTGSHLDFRDVDFNEFLIEQIKQRLRLKFNRPEVEIGVDIDKEVLKSIKNVLEIYKVEDFSALNLKNLVTEKAVTLSRAAVLEKIP